MTADPRAAILRVFEDQTECQDCGHRMKQWNPDALSWEYLCVIVESLDNKRPLLIDLCPGVEAEMAKEEE